MSQYGINWRQLRDQPDHKGTIVYFKKDTGETAIGPITKGVMGSSVLRQIAFEQNLNQQWDTDIGTKPTPVQFGSLNFSAFKGNEDTALYTEVLLDSRYEPSLPLKFGIYFRMEGLQNGGENVQLNFDYAFALDQQAVITSYTSNSVILAPTVDTNLHVAIGAEIPAQTSVLANTLLSLRFSRLAETSLADNNPDSVCILGMFIYQEAMYTNSVSATLSDIQNISSTLLSTVSIASILTAAGGDINSISIGTDTIATDTINNTISISNTITGIDLTALTSQQAQNLIDSIAAKYATDLGVPVDRITVTLAQGSIDYQITISGVDVQAPASVAVASISMGEANASVVHDGEPSQFIVTVLPSDATDKSVTWMSSNESALTVSSTGLVTAIAPGSADITATTVDGGFTATSTVWANFAPVARITAPQTSTINQLITLDATASSDPDGDTIDWSWVQDSGPSVVLGGTTDAPTFTPTQAGTYVFTLTVSDGWFQDTASVSIIVTEA